MKVDRELIEQTEALMWAESPPVPPKMQWTGRCRWMALLFILLAGLGLWRQNWLFFVVGTLGECVLIVLSLQFRVEVEQLFSSQSEGTSPSWLPVGAFPFVNPKPFESSQRQAANPNKNLLEEEERRRMAAHRRKLSH